MKKQAIGAHVCIKWIEQLHLPHAIEGAYISFGEYNEETETDGFGNPEDRKSTRLNSSHT